MPDYAGRLRSLVGEHTPRLLSLSAAAASARPAPGKWSPREILGHLVDSASNNHGRFVRAQLDGDLVFAGYEQDRWVSLQRYQDAPWDELVALWRSYNLHLAYLMEATPDEVRMRPRARHNLHEIAWRPVPADQSTTLDYFMRDYVGHMEHHLGQIPAHRPGDAHRADDGVDEVRELWPLLFVRDLAASVRHYVEGLGFQVAGSAHDEGGVFWCRLRRDGVSFMLQQAPAHMDLPRPPTRAVAFYFICDDVERLQTEFTSRGVGVRPPEVAYYGMRQLFVADPDGYEICFETPTDEWNG